MRGKGNFKIYYNGTVYPSFLNDTKCESIVTDDDRIAFCGNTDDALRMYGKNAISITNLDGKVIVPGFIDSHIHLDDLGNSLHYLDLRGTNSIAEMKGRLTEYKMRHPRIPVLIGMGWDQESFVEGRWPTKDDIDEIEKDVPVFLERFCEHAGVVNSKMLELLGTNTFSALVFPRTLDGSPSGIVKEDAAAFFKEKAHNMAGSEEENLAGAIKYLLSLGVTSIGFVSCVPESVEFLSREGGKLGLRVRVYLKESYANRLSELREKIGENPYLQINGIKLFADGALGAKTAALREPYEDDSTNKGMLFLDSTKLVEIFRHLDGKHAQFAIHAIGDRGIDSVIDAVSEYGRDKLVEPRIEHCTVLRDDHINKLRDLRIGISTQPAFVIDDWWAVRILGKSRSELSYPLATLYNNGINVGISTDSPVEPPDPWFSIDAAVNRGERERREILQYSKNERVSVSTALSLYTSGSASLLMDDKTGSLEVGKYADFLILDKDPFKTRDLKAITVLETIVGGISRFKRDFQ
jgi:predicted amidohydrolase YtcJ